MMAVMQYEEKQTGKMPYICPICQEPLKQHQQSKGYFCSKRHQFDLAREGYLNLLPVQHKKTKNPGDSRAMMRSRRHFLEAGFYTPMAEAIATLIDQYRTEHRIKHILDVGCGEGYYSRQIERFCHQSDRLDLHGMDIAKNAILAAAKKQPDGHFVVASTKRMPYADDYFDLLLRIYAPSEHTETVRVLKTGGFILAVTPGPRHLWQLREFIYKKVKEHVVESPSLDGCRVMSQQSIRFTIQPESDQRLALLQMTPFAWRASKEIQNAIAQVRKLDIETDFILTLVQKTD